ncbi:MAG TPA: condensation domain-containing protein, partial [Flavisolibacter sp.]
SHQDLPFEELLHHLNYKRIPGISPVFQARFVLNNSNDEAYEELEKTGLKVKRIIPREINSKFDLSLVMRTGTEHLSGIVEYRSSLFKREAIQMIVSAYTQLLSDISKDPGKTVAELESYGRLVQKQLSENKKGMQESLLKKLQNVQKIKT